MVAIKSDPFAQHLDRRLLPPFASLDFLLGTDQLGRDLLSRLIYGGMLSGLVALFAVCLAFAVGGSLGLVAGYYRGKLDSGLSWLATVQQALPFVVVAIALISALGPGTRNTIVALGLTSWVTYYRVLRAETLNLSSQDFVAAARALGASDLHVVFRHVLPNTVPSFVIMSTFELARMVMFETALSFLGLGLDPATPSWGNMLADATNYLAQAWWLPTFPGLAVMITILAINLIGDRLVARTTPVEGPNW